MSISRTWRASLLFALLSLGITAIAADAPRQSPRLPAQDLDALRPVDAPIVLCIDDKPTVGGQPSGQAYAKAMASGFRSVLTLRSPNDGVDLLRERLMVEKNRLRYFNLPALSALPHLDQVDEFLRLVRDPVNHPMLINCAFAERVAPYIMIFRMVEQGWSEDKAIEEAVRSGLRADPLKRLAREYASRLKATNQ